MREVVVELILLRADPQGWSYRRQVAPLDREGDPSELARSLAGEPLLLHSTSWRHEPGQGIVLTYAAYPDPDPDAPADELDELEVAFGAAPDDPRPAELAPAHVAAHAIRHLAFLAASDPVTGAAIAADATVAALLGGISAGAAGLIPSGRT
ncbi:hypothetical protein [Nonomuraea sediminis]|uniref:hypothetical protein n=1 Tax=Nonomuraea sediminis TaxID=2835864 RepID=UPI001BDD83B2|nr:hypothetical protein [Nonomuraea sediminis]